MNKNIINKDDNGNWHGKQIYHYSNGNIRWIGNYHHDKANGYRAWFKSDKTIRFKQCWNMNKWIYSEDHWANNKIEIKI